MAHKILLHFKDVRDINSNFLILNKFLKGHRELEKPLHNEQSGFGERRTSIKIRQTLGFV